MAGKSRAVLVPLMAVAVLALFQGMAWGQGPGEVVGLSTDEVWSGRVVLDKTVVIKKGATLTILPGTRIEFIRRDLDDDGIGDVALRVEGRLVAKGSARDPILFTSGMPLPRPADWKYVMLEFSRDSLFEHCSFSYAFSGMQAHYSTATVTDCIFTRNIDGFRFSTANVRLLYNLMEENVNGIRYEERKSRTEISRNCIRNNDTGIFCIMESDDTTLFRDNNIYHNRRYNFKMGLLQKKDVHLPGNWWGSGDISEIGSGIFDGNDDRGLGRVFFEPALTGKMANAGPRIDESPDAQER